MIVIQLAVGTPILVPDVGPTPSNTLVHQDEILSIEAPKDGTFDLLKTHPTWLYD